MRTRRILSVLLIALLMVCLYVGSALACECGSRHAKEYPVNAGEQAKYITLAQKQLKTLGYRFTEKPGVVNDSMKRALRSFQYDAALKNDGVLNTCTLNRLELRSSAVKANRSSKTWKNLFNGDYRLLARGYTGTRVRTLNKYLYELGYNTTPTSNTYTSQTAAAVKAFQKKYLPNRTADGKAGPYTLSMLEKVYGAKKK